MNTKVCLLLVLSLMIGAAQAAEFFGTVDAMAGTASLNDESGASVPLSTGAKIYVGQRIATGADGEVHVVTADSGLIALRPNSSFRIDRYQAKGEDTDEIAFSLFKGALRSITGWIAKRNPSAYRLSAVTTTIGVRGTDHETTIIEAQDGSTLPGIYDTVYEGTTVLKNTQGNVEVHAGESAFAGHEARHAPGLLAQRPAFLERRTFHIEQRIRQRKENLHDIVRKRVDELADNDHNSAMHRAKQEHHSREPRQRQRQ
jgi:hypothetical protein